MDGDVLKKLRPTLRDGLFMTAGAVGNVLMVPKVKGYVSDKSEEYQRNQARLMREVLEEEGYIKGPKNQYEELKASIERLYEKIDNLEKGG